MSRKRGYLLPSNFFPPDAICFQVLVPNDPGYIRAFWGQMQELSRWGMWESEETKSGTLAAQRWLQTYLGIEACEGVVEVPIMPIEFQVVDCWLQWRADSEDPWANLANVCGEDGEDGEDGAPGAPGTPGAPGAPGQPGSCDCIADPGANPEGEGDVRRCNAAIKLTEWLFDRYNDVIDSVEAAADTISALDLIFALFPPGYLIADGFTDAINEIIEATINVARAWDTETKREEEAMKIYCLLSPEGQLTAAAWDEYLEEYLPTVHTDPGKAAYADYVTRISADGAIARANMGTYADDEECLGWDCIEENCANQILDFTASSDCSEARYIFSEFITNDQYESAEWISGLGWSSVFVQFGTSPTSNLYRRLQVYVDIADTPQTVTEIRFVWTGNNVSQCSIFDVTSGETNIANFAGTPAQRIWSGSRSMTRILVVLEIIGTNGNPPPGAHYLEEIEITTT